MSAVLAVEKVRSRARASACTPAQILGKDFVLWTAGTPGIEVTNARIQPSWIDAAGMRSGEEAVYQTLIDEVLAEDIEKHVA